MRILQRTKTARLYAVVIFTLLGCALRLYQINAVSLRGDEAFTMIHWVREPLSQTLREIATVDPQPPLAYAVYHVWGILVGTGERTIRFLPALLNLIGVPVLYALGKRVGGVSVGMLCAFLWAINPYQLYHAQDARNYALWGAFSPLALWLALRAIENGRRRDWVLYIAAAGVTVYLYYLELFALFVLTLYVVVTYRRERRIILKWFAVMVIIGAALSVWIFQDRLLFGSGYGGTAGGFDPSQLVSWFIPTLMFGETIAGTTAFIIIILSGLVVSVFLLSQRHSKYAFLFAMMGTIPLLLLGIVSLRLNVFVPRYVLLVSPIYLVLNGVLISRLYQYRRVVGAVVLSSFFVVNVTSLHNYYVTVDYAKAPDWRALGTFLRVNVQPDDLVIQTAADEAYTFYHEEYGVASDYIRLPANPQQPPNEITQSLLDSAARYDSLWIVATTPPNWSNRGIVEAWLNANMQRVRSDNVNGLRAEQYRAYQVDASEIAAQPLAIFSDTAALVGTRIIQPHQSGGDITVWLYWHPMVQTDADLKIFVHLIGETNPTTGSPLWAQDDQMPQDGRVTTRNWEIDTVYRDVYVLPTSGIPARTYTLQVGFYDPLTGTRIPVGEGDSTTIGAVSLD